MRDIVAKHAPADRSISLLDFGCGTGSLLFRLADALPAARLTGIDVSAANIAAARVEQARRPAAARIRFDVADYLQYGAGPFDVIVSAGVLHLVSADTEAIVGKLAADVVPGGLFICDMAMDCAYNRAFASVRRLLRRIRSPWLDRAIMHAGRVLHSREMSDEGLRERVDYMYMPPTRMMNGALAARFSAAGLSVVTDYPMKSASLSQLRHRVTIFVRRDA